MVDKKRNDEVDPTDDVPTDPVVEDSSVDDDTIDDEALADDFIDVGDADEVPEELREDRPDPAAVPKTGLVSEFHDLSASQAAYLVAHRETSSVSRSPLFYVTSLLLGVAVIAAMIIGFQQAGAGPGEGEGSDTLAIVGVPQEQVDAFSQQLGLPAVAVEDQAAGEALLRSGEAGAVYVLDPTGMQPASLLALNRDPEAILDKLNQPVPVDYLEQPAVAPVLGDPVAWGLGIVVALAGLTLGAALYQNLRTEKRNRLAEVIASTIPARSSAWGRVYGLSLLSLTFTLIAAGVLLIGLSIGQQTTIAMALLPVLGWFALIALMTVFIILSAHLWVATSASRRVRRIGYAAVVLLTVAGVLAPLVLRTQETVMLWLSYTPFTAPVAMPMRYLAGQAEWWEGLASAGASAVVGVIVFWLASAAYQRTLLRGAGRSGRKAKAGVAAKSGSTAKNDSTAKSDSTSKRSPAKSKA